MDRLTKRVDDGKAWYNHAHEKSVTNDDLLERLAVYEDAEEQGRLLVLPPKEKMTNADLIRAMSDEELCELLLIGGGACNFCRPEDKLPFHACTVEGCKNAMRNFLRQPAEGGKQDGTD